MVNSEANVMVNRDTNTIVRTHGTDTWYGHMVRTHGTDTWQGHMVQTFSASKVDSAYANLCYCTILTESN